MTPSVVFVCGPGALPQAVRIAAQSRALLVSESAPLDGRIKWIRPPPETLVPIPEEFHRLFQKITGLHLSTDLTIPGLEELPLLREVMRWRRSFPAVVVTLPTRLQARRLRALGELLRGWVDAAEYLDPHDPKIRRFTRWTRRAHAWIAGTRCRWLWVPGMKKPLPLPEEQSDYPSLVFVGGESDSARESLVRAVVRAQSERPGRVRYFSLESLPESWRAASHKLTAALLGNAAWSSGLSKLLTRLLPPGHEECAALDHLIRHTQPGTSDRLVVDVGDDLRFTRVLQATASIRGWADAVARWRFQFAPDHPMAGIAVQCLFFARKIDAFTKMIRDRERCVFLYAGRRSPSLTQTLQRWGLGQTRIDPAAVTV
jgi:hypothetical protein